MGDGTTADGMIPWQDAQACPARLRRIMLLLSSVVVLSAADLLITLARLRTTGMWEANPVASMLIRSTGSPAALVLLKSISVGLCVAFLYRARRSVSGEIGAWLAACIVVTVAVVWILYNGTMSDPEVLRLARLGGAGDWLVLR